MKISKASKRIKLMVVKNLFWLLKQKRKITTINRENTMSMEERYQYAQDILTYYHKMAKVTIVTTGLDDIPSDIQGCIFYANHQGGEDCPAILASLPNLPTSYLIAKEQEQNCFMGPVMHMLQGKALDMKDLKAQVTTYLEMVEEIKNGKRYIIFPEAGYTDNHNTLQEFHTPCFMPAIKSKCPIIPICLYDSWQVFEVPHLKPLTVYCHFLKPIYYEEYQGLSRQELCALVKERIQQKLNEIEQENKE